jgi:hypothetical protein
VILVHARNGTFVAHPQIHGIQRLRCSKGLLRPLQLLLMVIIIIIIVGGSIIIRQQYLLQFLGKFGS